MGDFVSFVEFADEKPNVVATRVHGQTSSAAVGSVQHKVALLHDEIESAVCEDVSFNFQFEDPEQGRIACTKVRLRFTPDVFKLKEVPRRSVIIDDYYDVPLCCIARIYVAMVKSNSKVKKYELMESNISSMKVISSIRIILKDFRVVTIGLHRSQNGTHLANQILFFSMPSTLETMPQIGGSFFQKGVEYKPNFNSLDSWKRELERCGCSIADGAPWRVCSLNKEGFTHTAQGYPMYVVLPAFLARGDIDRMMQLWKLGRIPIWTYSYHSTDTSLLISASHEDNLATPAILAKLADSVTRCQSSEQRPYNMHLPADFLPKLSKAYVGLMNMSATDSFEDWLKLDKNWLQKLHDAGWLDLLTEVMQKTASVMHWMIDEERSVILFEKENRDEAILISSLVQICMDPFSRTMKGFNQLIEKMWIGLGHPFGSRLLARFDENVEQQPKGGVKAYGSDVLLPTWLLFLDAVGQLIRREDHRFEFSRHLLLALWDVSLTGFVPSFACNCVEEQLASRVGGSHQPFHYFFTADYTKLFTNVFVDAQKFIGVEYNDGEFLNNVLNFRIPDEDSIIQPPKFPGQVEYWRECYQRWIPTSGILNGGRISNENAIDKKMVNVKGKSGEKWESRINLPESFTDHYPYSPVDPLPFRLQTLRSDDMNDDSISFRSVSNSPSMRRASLMSPDDFGYLKEQSWGRSFSVKVNTKDQKVAFQRKTPSTCATPEWKSMESLQGSSETPVARARTSKKPLPPPRPLDLKTRFTEKERSADCLPTVVRL